MHKVVLDVRSPLNPGPTITPQPIPDDIKNEEDEEDDFDISTEQMEYESFIEHMKESTGQNPQKPH